MRILSRPTLPGAILALVSFCGASCSTPPEAAVSSTFEPAEASAGAADARLRAEGSRGGVVVLCASRPAPIPLNEPFELDVEVRSSAAHGQAVDGARVYVTGWMPDHQHGMVRQPETTELGGGRYRIEGMLFHMPGHWELRVDVIAGRKPERATFDVHL
ncbi:MAG: FixH family protein [Planctomycetota bacterium]